MKTLKQYIEECDGVAPGNATPGNTMGMGNPMAPTDGEPGSGDTFDHQKAKLRRKRKQKRINNYE